MSRIEEIIDDIENYIDECKPSAFSQSKVVVNKEDLEELLTELRLQIPEEVKTYQKIIANQEAIINRAKDEAAGMVDEANKLQSQMVDEHEIMQKAYTNANKVIEDANRQAEEIVNRATAEAAAMKRSIMKYTDEMLGSLQTVMEHVMDGSKTKFDSFMNSVQSDYEIVTRNRKDLEEANKD